MPSSRARSTRAARTFISVIAPSRIAVEGQEKEGSAQGFSRLDRRINHSSIRYISGNWDGLVGKIGEERQHRAISHAPFDDHCFRPEHPITAGKRRHAAETRNDLYLSEFE